MATSVLKADWRLPVFSRVVQTRPSRSPTINSGCFRCSPSLGRGRKAVPTTVRRAFRSAGLEPARVVGWGDVPDTLEAGVYVVALTADPDPGMRTVGWITPAL